MGFKTILVHVEASSESETRVQLATALAHRLSARLIGVGGCVPASIDNIGAIDGQLLEVIADNELADLVEAEAAFRRISASLREAIDWRSGRDYPDQVMAETAAGADLIVVSAKRGPHASTADAGAAALTSGIPVLMVPEDPRELKLKKILIAWKNTREARRAVTDALPLLCAAEDVVLVEAGDGTTPSQSAELVIDRLRRHGVEATTGRASEDPDEPGADLILSAQDCCADLIVAGAYGHSRLREWCFGGMTRGLLAASPLPVLFSH